jgi:hypothetical protein
MFTSVGDSIELLYGGSDPRVNDVRPMHAVYWHAIEWAIANGKTVIDWGTAPVESSLGKFKAQWDAEPVEGFRYTYGPRATVGSLPQPSTLAKDGGDGESMSEAAWERVPVDALGVATTIAHRVL